MTNRQITISVGASRKATRWIPTTLWWSEFVERLQVPQRGTETLESYMALPKGQQDSLKDVGGYVGGTLKGGRRKANAVERRDLITLDLDNIPAEGTDDAIRRVTSTECACVIYSTRKHSRFKPRLRAVFLLDEPCTADEYEPIARKLAEHIGIHLCDPTTFEASRLMYWPSCCIDSEYVWMPVDGGMLDRQATLALYADWRDVNAWPRVPGEERKIKHADKLGDPREKDGIVGAFCRQYDIYRALDELLPGVYTPTDLPGRYTYAAGSTAGGAVVYDDGLFLYSHHATDPCSGREVNAFDLVRLHMFGELDDECTPGTPLNRLPSMAAMAEFALQQPTVALDMQQARVAKAAEAFAEASPDAPAADTNWLMKLSTNKQTGAIQKTVDNVVIILENDPLLAGKVVFDEFSQRAFVVQALPWKPQPAETRRIWTDKDDSQLIRYIEKVYGITGDQRIYHGMSSYLDSHAINEVRDYLQGLTWDGTPRLDTLLIDYLGADDTPYVRAVTRKAFCAAVARVLQPGIKYDTVLILHGGQGIGKSTLLATMGGAWHCDSLDTFEGKEAAELIQGMWIIELGELAALNRSDMEQVKHFITKQTDQFRVPYGRQTSVYPRRCVFFGSTNRREHLRDTTGNRRWWPVDCDARRRTKSPWRDLPGERDQIWAEAHAWYTMIGEDLYLPPELEMAAQEQQRDHMEEDPRTSMVAEFLARPLPKDWKSRSISDRRIYWGGGFTTERGTQVETEPRLTVSRQEIWCECFGRDPAVFGRREAAEVDAIMAAIEGWERHPSTFRNGPYGTEKGYQKRKLI
jgi:putative DNA primase/helicase